MRTLLYTIYLSFTITSNSNDFLNDYPIKIADKIVISKGEEITFTLTDETSILIDKTITKITEILNAAEFIVFNYSSTVLKDITYDGATYEGELPSDYYQSAYVFDLTNEPSSLIFEIKTRNGFIKVRTKDLILFHNNRKYEYIFTDDTIVILEGTSKEVPIKNLL